MKLIYLLSLFSPGIALTPPPIKEFPEMTETLFKMTRPTTLPRAALASFMGSAAIHTNTLENIINPDFILPTTLATGVCANSMIVNDYYDAKVGNDDQNKNAIVNGDISYNVVKNYLAASYTAIFLASFFLKTPELTALTLFGTFATIIYTPILKNITFVKNLSVAAIVSLTPAIGAIATSDNFYDAFTNPDYRLVNLFLAIFAGQVHQELLMDLSDTENDIQAQIKTIPTIFGKEKTVLLSGLMLYIMAFNACNSEDAIAVYTALAPSIVMFYDASIVKKHIGGPEEKNKIKIAIDHLKYTTSLIFISFII